MTETKRDHDAPLPRRSPGSRAAGLAGHIERLPRGDRAELRRLAFKDQPPAAFWRLAAHPDRGFPAHEEPFWMAILPLMATHPHAPGRPLGRRLAEAGVSFARVERWMRYPQDRALGELRKLLARVDGGVDWGQLADTLWFWQQQPERLRGVARDYFRAQPAVGGDASGPDAGPRSGTDES